jgi:hypothetical protein
MMLAFKPMKQLWRHPLVVVANSELPMGIEPPSIDHTVAAHSYRMCPASGHPMNFRRDTFQ